MIHQINAIVEPSTVEEALQSDQKKEWSNAMNKEYEALLKNKTWKLCDLTWT